MKAVLPHMRSALARMLRPMAARSRAGTLELPGYRPDDAFLCSYPRSGNTWLRYLIAAYRVPDAEIAMDDFERLLPDLHELRRDRLAGVSQPRIFKTHALPSIAYPRIAYIVRDPRDVLCSHFTYLRTRAKFDGDLSRFVDLWIAGAIWPGRWDDHVTAYQAALERQPGSVVRYEALQAEPVDTLLQVVAALGLAADRGLAADAVARTTIDAYRRDVAGRGYAPEAHGRIGRWRGLLDPDQARRVATAFAPVMQACGYD